MNTTDSCNTSNFDASMDPLSFAVYDLLKTDWRTDVDIAANLGVPAVRVSAILRRLDDMGLVYPGAAS